VPASVGWRIDELQAIIADDEYNDTMESLPFVCTPTSSVTSYLPSLDTIRCSRCDKMGHFAQYCTNIFGRSTIPVTPVPEPIVLRSHPLNKNSLRQTSRPISNVPFYKLICKRCRKMGHLAKSCPNTPPPSMNKIMCSKCDQFGHYAYNCHVTKTPLNSRYADN
jgi:hypothetical protein